MLRDETKKNINLEKGRKKQANLSNFSKLGLMSKTRNS